MHKEPIRAHFIAASKTCKIYFKKVSKAFKLIFHQIQSFYNKPHFYFLYKPFCVTENIKSILENIEKIYWKANAKAISVFGSFTLYTKFPHFDLISVMNNIIGLTFKGGNKKCNDFSGNTAFYSFTDFLCHNLNTCIFLKRTIYRGQCNNYWMSLFWIGKPNCITDHWNPNGYWTNPFLGQFISIKTWMWFYWKFSSERHCSS